MSTCHFVKPVFFFPYKKQKKTSSPETNPVKMLFLVVSHLLIRGLGVVLIY